MSSPISTLIAASKYALSPSAAVPVVMTRAPFDTEGPSCYPVTANIHSSSSTSITASKYSLHFSAAVSIVVTRAPIKIEISPF